MDDLIARLEKATGPDRDLDGLIFQATEPRMVECWPHWTADQREMMVAHYTRSIDAALTLVPQGSVWTIEASSAWVRVLEGDDVREEQAAFCGREADSTALALCIAALKARQPRRTAQS